MENASLVGSGASASLLLGRKLDSIPFSIYHLQIILVLGVVGFVEGYDLALGGSLLVLAKEPLHLTPRADSLARGCADSLPRGRRLHGRVDFRPPQPQDRDADWRRTNTSAGNPQ